MTISEILNTTNHRPWDVPRGSWKYYQEWNDGIFLHWQVDYNELRKLVPQDLELDLFQGKPWVSMVAFTMEKIRPKNLPAFPPISAFHEINIRTYVKLDNKRGVYFLSIEGGKKLSCIMAKGISGLPYRFSNITRTKNTYESYNSKLNDKLFLKFSIGDSMPNKTSIDNWLIERYALFQDTEKSINQFDIHHLEWSIREINFEIIEINYSRFKNLINNYPDRVHYSRGVKVLAWGVNKNKKKAC